MLNEKLIEFAKLEHYFRAILPAAPTFDVDKKEFQAYFEELKRRTLTLR
jgi:hypothetical protein